MLPRQDFLESRDEDGDHGGERAGAVQTAAGQGIESGLDRGDVRGAGNVVDGADAVVYGAGIGVLASPGENRLLGTDDLDGIGGKRATRNLDDPNGNRITLRIIRRCANKLKYR